jgi:acetylornithine deacetylase/succinyl-diaminopimelate desuccinylase family protein
MAPSSSLNLLKDLIAVRTDAGEVDGVAFVAAWFRERNIEHVVQELDGVPMNVVGTIGRGQRSIMLHAHIDTVPPGDASAWSSDPFRAVERDGHLVGRGSVDDKGCLAAMLCALDRLRADEASLPGRVVLAAVGGEERGGLGTQLLVREGIRTEAAIVGEATSLRPLVAHKGCLRLWVTVLGVAAHASRPDLGVNSIVGLARLIPALEALAHRVAQRHDRLTGSASLAITTVQGGSALNMIPDRCTLSVDRRLVPQERYEDALAEIDAVLAQVEIEHGVRCRREVHRFIAPAHCTSDELVAGVRRSIAGVTGTEPEVGGLFATCDMSFLVNDANIPTLVLGPGDTEEAHQYNEKLDLSQLLQAEAIYATIVRDWLTR